LEQPQKSSRLRSLFSFCAFHFLDDGFTDSVYLLLPFIAAELHLSFSQVGLLKGLFSGSMGLLQFPLSFVGEKIGEMVVIGVGAVGLPAGFLVLSRVHSYEAVLLSLVLAKASSAGQHGLSSSLLSKVFELSGRRAAMGTYNFAGDLGKVCLPFALALMIQYWGWREGVFFLSFAGMIAGSILVILARRGRVHLEMARPIQETSSTRNRWDLKSVKRFSVLLAIGMIDIATRNALLTFLPFLLLRKGIPAAHVGFALTLLFAGGAVGKFSCGLLAEWFGVIPMVVGTEILTAAGILSLLWSAPEIIWVILPLVGIVLNGTSSVLYATVAEIISPGARSRGYGFYYAVTLGCGALSPVVYGWVTDSFGLSTTLTAVSFMILLTLPLSMYLPGPKSS
jgi:MFS transporter, FSR family, fosmidomycin resistance protein